MKLLEFKKIIMEIIKIQSESKLLALKDQEIRDIVNAVYSTMQSLDALLATPEVKEDQKRTDRLSNEADRLEKIYESLKMVAH